jgi:pimeloyl-ACP methyl ester carboxylesterase
MPRAQSNGIELEYETFGDRESGRPLVIIRGLGTQMIQWASQFREGLVERGHFLVTFDNRDVGKSQWFDEAGVPSIPEVTAAVQEGRDPGLAYSLEDMADDVIGLLDFLEVDSAHIAGMSMGGMLTTVVGYRHPDRVRSLVPIMASTGNPSLPPPTPAAMEALMSPAPRERDAFIAHHVRTSKAISSPGFPTADEARAEMAARVYDRAFHPEGTARQYLAIGVSGDRRKDLSTITAPTLVIHGIDDPLVSVEGGRDIAATIQGAELLEIPGMGHDLPVGLCETIADAITDHTRKAESAAKS